MAANARVSFKSTSFAKLVIFVRGPITTDSWNAVKLSVDTKEVKKTFSTSDQAAAIPLRVKFVLWN